MIRKPELPLALGSPGHGGIRRRTWRYRLVCAAMTMGTFAQGARAAQPNVALMGGGDGECLTDVISMLEDGASGQRVVLFGTKSLTLGSGQSVYYSGGTVCLVTETEDATVVTLYDGEGRILRTVSLPPGVKTMAFGKSVASYAPSLHAPGIPYLLDVDTPTGSVHLAREGRTVTDLRALETHLVITSRNAAGVYETEVLNGGGQVDWVFSEPGLHGPRVVVDGDRALAVFADRPNSILQFAQAKRARARRMVLKGAVMTNAAFLTNGPEAFVWGSRDAAWVDLERLRTRWQRSLAIDGQQLPNGTSSVATVDKMVPTLTRTELPDGTWRVDLMFLQLSNGSTVHQQTLYETGSVPACVRRITRGSNEYLVLPDRVYAVSSGQEGGR